MRLITAPRLIIACSIAVSRVFSQHIGTYENETHPALIWKRCIGTGGTTCTNVNGRVTLDSNWRWTHVKDTYYNCYSGNEWNATSCPTNKDCANNCALEGADYKNVYGVVTSKNSSSIDLKFKTNYEYGSNIGSRIYLMKSDDESYEMFNLVGNEIAFDVDVSSLSCGISGALYFVQMPERGFGEAGAKYGTGYCDASCPRDLRYIKGEANAEGWTPSSTNQNSGTGGHGACCPQLDLFQANSISTSLTANSCRSSGYTVCEGSACGATYSNPTADGPCDFTGCDFNPYRVGATEFFGKGKTVDTAKPITVVTQFIGNGTNLKEIKRYYVQNGKVIADAEPTVPGLKGKSITQDYCDQEAQVFEEKDYPFKSHGGLDSLGQAMNAGMVLVMSVWDDQYANMLWLDGSYPPNANATKPGVARGTCPSGSGRPEEVEPGAGNSKVTFSNIKFGPIGSTFAQPANT